MFVHWPGDGGTKKKYKNTKNRGQASADIIKRYLICLPVWFNDVRYQGQANNLAADKHNKFSRLENMHACTGVHQTLSFNPLLLKLANRSRFMSVLDHRFVRLFFFFQWLQKPRTAQYLYHQTYSLEVVLTRVCSGTIRYMQRFTWKSNDATSKGHRIRL